MTSPALTAWVAAHGKLPWTTLFEQLVTKAVPAWRAGELDSPNSAATHAASGLRRDGHTQEISDADIRIPPNVHNTHAAVGTIGAEPLVHAMRLCTAGT